MTTWRRAPAVLWRRSGTRTVLAPPGADEPLLVEGTGSLTWELLAEPRDEAGLVAELARVYDVDARAVAPEVTAFLDELSAAGAVVRA